MNRVCYVVLGSLALCACSNSRPHAYLITDSVASKVKDPITKEEKSVLVFTIRHQDATIKARCDLYDSFNSCYRLHVGETYEFKDDNPHGFLIIQNFQGGPDAVLAVAEEHLHN